MNLEAQVQETKKARCLSQALRASKLVEAMIQAIPSVPMPRSECDGFLAAALQLLQELSSDGVVDELSLESIQATVNSLLYKNPCDAINFDELRRITTTLKDGVERQVEEFRALLTSAKQRAVEEHNLLGEQDLRRFDKHRASLERSMDRLLGILKSIQNDPSASKDEPTGSGSFGKDLAVQLKVVR